MGVYLRAKFEVSNLILTGCRQGVIFPPPPPTLKQTPKKTTQISVLGLRNACEKTFLK